jgi:hypothetical protein
LKYLLAWTYLNEGIKGLPTQNEDFIKRAVREDESPSLIAAKVVFKALAGYFIH